jgi:hypothetical protein
MAATKNGVFRGRGLGVSFHLRCPQGVASVLCEKTPIFRSRRSKLENLTVNKRRNRLRNSQTLTSRKKDGRDTASVDYTHPRILMAWEGILLQQSHLRAFNDTQKILRTS